MNSNTIPYFSNNRLLLLVVGLYPYTQTKLARFQSFLLFSIMITYVIAKFMAVITAEWTTEFIINFFSIIFLHFSFIVKYIMFYINNDDMKYLLEQIQDTYNELKDQRELIILKRYGIIAKRYTDRIILFALCITCVLLYFLLSPRILDIVLPINESRKHSSLLKPAEYFIDEEKYFLLIGFHGIIAFGIGGIVMIGIATLLQTYTHYGCGMFRIASYRIEQAMAFSNLENNISENEDLTYKGIIYAVNMHLKAMKYLEYLVSATKLSYAILIILVVLSASLNLYQIYQGILSRYDAEQYALSFIVLSICYVYIFFANYVSQKIIDHNHHIFVTAYNSQWYMTSLHIQKLILFLMQRNTKTFSININGLFVGSLESFIMLIGNTLSYFTIIYSTMQR